MNRLIIIGNGFDLAHKMETSYEHFLLDYFKKVALQSLKTLDTFENDEFLDCYTNELLEEENIEKIFNSLKSLDELFQHNLIYFSSVKTNWNNQLIENKKPISFCLKNAFFNSLIKNKNWTDIESFYFNRLIIEFDKSKSRNEYSKPNPKELNRQFSILKDKIYAYLEEQNQKSKHLLDSRYHDFINETLRGINHFNDGVIFLNFNYTDTLNHYTKFDFQVNHEVINIHGTLSNPNSLIFGYGDDSHKRYADLEDSVDDEYLINIKSHMYNSDDNYEKLINFIEGNEFEVYIVGHSLGLSDRVLLKAIFENKYCTKVRLYHRGNLENHFKKRIALSRHFSDKIAYRNKTEVFNPEYVFK